MNDISTIKFLNQPEQVAKLRGIATALNNPGGHPKDAEKGRSPAKEASEDFLTCTYCRKTSAEVESRQDPYELDVNDVEIFVTICPACYNDRCDEI